MAANRYATKTGVWSDVTVWDGGATLPGVGDVVRPNGFTVTIDQDITVGELRNDASAPAAANGAFVITSIPGGGRIVNADLVLGGTSTYVLTVSIGGTLTINGDLYSISGINSVSAIGSLNVAHASAVVIINGDVTGADHINTQAKYTLLMATTGAHVTINGNVTGGAGSSSGIRPGVALQGVCTLIVNGDVSGAIAGTSTGIAAGIYHTSTSTVEITGAVSGGVTTEGPGVYSSAPGGTVDIDGPVLASTNNSGIKSTSSCLFRVRGPITDASNGRSALYAPRRILHASPADTDWTVRDDSGFPTVGAAMLLTNIGNGMPDPADVAAGVVYGTADEHTGTMPTSELTAAEVWNYLTADADTLNSIGRRLRNVATVDSVGDQVAAAVGV
jgi:hypothetical protein